MRRELPHGNLEIYVDFEDKDAEGNVEFTIWTNMSDVLEHVNDENGLSSPNALHRALKSKLAMRFIDESGALRRENWGLAEMRISAGYLQGRKISEIGGLDTLQKPIIEPVVQTEEINSVVEGASKTTVHHLAYRFSVPKPKEILFLVDDVGDGKDCKKADEIFKQWKQREVEFKKLGIYAMRYSEVTPKENEPKPKLNYEFVVMDDMRKEHVEWFLPFRVLTIKPTGVDGAKDMVPSLPKDYGWSSCLDVMRSLLDCKGIDGEFDAEVKTKVLDKIFACWCKYIKNRHMNSGDVPMKLILTVKEDNKGNGNSNAGQGLISKRDVVKFIFEETFNSVARAFIDLNQLKKKVPVKPSDDNHLKARCNKCGMIPCACSTQAQETLDSLMALMKPSANKIIRVSNLKGSSYESLVICQLLNWCESISMQGTVLEYLKKRNGNLSARGTVEKEQIQKEIDQIESLPAADQPLDVLMRLYEQRSAWDDTNESETAIHYFKGFIDYLVKVCDQMETILCKYAENIVSLPKGFGSAGNVNSTIPCTNWDDANLWFWKGPRKIGLPEDQFDETEKALKLHDASNIIKGYHSIEFVRHSNPYMDVTDDRRMYIESLSGSQSYLTVLERANSESKQLITKLVETAFLRILIVDERVAKFLREHKGEVARIFRNMHLYVANDKKMDDELSLFHDVTRNKDMIDKLKAERWCQPVLDYNEENILLPLSSYNVWEGRQAIDGKDISGHEDRMNNLIKKFKTTNGKKLFDILIIHQGIIDKWFPGTANDSKKVKTLLQFLRQLFPYVVITTGRGSPANIPETARMLPFSTIETTLFRKYPEKLLLVDAIMNLLPKGGMSNE